MCSLAFYVAPVIPFLIAQFATVRSRMSLNPWLDEEDRFHAAKQHFAEFIDYVVSVYSRVWLMCNRNINKPRLDPINDFQTRGFGNRLEARSLLAVLDLAVCQAGSSYNDG